jgi:hypothetical protein
MPRSFVPPRSALSSPGIGLDSDDGAAGIEAPPCIGRYIMLRSLAAGDVAAREAVLAGARVLGAVTLVAAVVSAGAVGSGAAQSTARLPAPLVGAWARFITAADWARVGIATEPPVHTSMLVSANGGVVAGESTSVRFAPLSGSRVVISGAYGCGKKKGVYRWRVAAGRLTLTKLQDTCAYSVGVYAGVWKREKT